jgi:hypothetical protein
MPRGFGVQTTDPGGCQQSRHGCLADHRQNGRTAAFLGYSPCTIQRISTGDGAKSYAGIDWAPTSGTTIER